MPTTRIKVRSPYYKKYSHADLNYVELDIRIYTGSFTSGLAGTPKYSLKKYEIATNNYVVFEVSELIRDYIQTEFDGTYDNEPVWVYLAATLYESDGTQIGSGTDNTYLLAFDGYTLFEEGINYTTDAPVFITDRVDTPTSEVTIYRPSDKVIRIPVNVDNTDGNETGWSFKLIEPDNTEVETSVSNSSNSSGQIYYINVGTQYNKVELYENEPSPSLPTKRYTVHIEEMDCNKYDAIKVTFYNRWGALQDLFFTAKHTQSIRTKEEDYKSNLIDFSTLSYSTTRHQAQTFHKQGKERITLNTGNVNEDYNEWIKELMLSEKVWMTKDSTVYPIKVTSSELIEQTSINDKVFNYTIQAEYAFDKVQNIR
jgi:hypothetical protein